MFINCNNYGIILILYVLYIAWWITLYSQLYTFAKFILHVLSVLQHVSAHHKCHHQGVKWSIVHNGPFDSAMITTKKTPWWWHVRCAETCWRTDNMWRINLVNGKLVLQTELITEHFVKLSEISSFLFRLRIKYYPQHPGPWRWKHEKFWLCVFEFVRTSTGDLATELKRTAMSSPRTELTLNAAFVETVKCSRDLFVTPVL